MVHIATTAAESCLPPAGGPSSRTSPAWITLPAQGLPGSGSGVLQGLRFAVKDNIDVAGWPTTAACAAFAYTPPAHAAVVAATAGGHGALLARQDQPGPVRLTGLVGTRSPYGAVPNAFDPAYVSGGSSSGSARVPWRTGQVDVCAGHRHRRLRPRAGRAEQYCGHQAVARAHQRARGGAGGAKCGLCVHLRAQRGRGRTGAGSRHGTRPAGPLQPHAAHAAPAAGGRASASVCPTR